MLGRTDAQPEETTHGLDASPSVELLSLLLAVATLGLDFTKATIIEAGEIDGAGSLRPTAGPPGDARRLGSSGW